MKKGQTGNLINNMPDGFAYFQVVLTDKSEPLDYLCRQINHAFSNLTGLTEEKMVGKLVSEIYPAIETLGIDWLGIYTLLEKTGKPIELEHYFSLFEKWFAVTAYLDQPRHVAIIIKDITALITSRQELKASEAFARIIMDKMPLGLSVNSVDPGVIFTYLNDNFLKFYHTTREALSEPDAFWKIVYEDPEFRAEIKKRVEDDCASGDPNRMRWENVPITKDGQVVAYISATNTPVPDKNLMISTVWDVTDRVRAEKALEDNYTLLRLAGETAKFGGWNVDLEINKCTWSDQVAIIHEMPIGYSPPVEEGISFYAPQWREKITAVFTACAEEGIPYDEEMEIITAKGRRVWVRTVGEAVKDDQGNIIKVQGSFQDISEHKKAEKMIQKQRDLIQSYLDTTETIMVSLGPDGSITMLNRYGLMILEYGEEEIIGKNWFEIALPQPEGMEKVFPVHRRIMNGDLTPVRYFENDILSASGKRYSIGWRNSHLLNEEGKVVGTLSSGMDITERKKAEEALRRSEEKLEQRVKERTVELEAVNKELASFAYSVSHDFRAPLRALDGFSASLTEKYNDQLDEQGLHYLNRIRNAAIYMSNLVDDLLKLSRVTRTELKKERTDLSKLAAGILADMQENEPDRKVEISVEPNLLARGDSHLLQIVLTNLLGNAWKFSSQEAHSKIEMGRTTLNGEGVFFVRDNGVGFNMAYADKLFGAFQRLHGINEFSGTGIGLATVQRIINRHGGRIWADSEIGKGATFYFTIPV